LVNTQVNKLAVLFGSKLFENLVRGSGVSELLRRS